MGGRPRSVGRALSLSLSHRPGPRQGSLAVPCSERVARHRRPGRGAMRTQGDRVDPPWSTSLLPSSPSPWAFRFSRAHSRLHSVRHLNHQPSSSTPGASPDSRLGRRRGSPWTRCDVSAGPGWRRDGGRRAQGKRQVRGREERKMSPGVERGEARGRSSFCPFLSLCSPEAIPGHSARDQASAPVIRDPNSYRLLVSGTRRRARSCPQRAGKGHGGSVEHWERALRVPSSSSFSLVLSIRAPGPPLDSARERGAVYAPYALLGSASIHVLSRASSPT